MSTGSPSKGNLYGTRHYFQVPYLTYGASTVLAAIETTVFCPSKVFFDQTHATTLLFRPSDLIPYAPSHRTTLGTCRTRRTNERP